MKTLNLLKPVALAGVLVAASAMSAEARSNVSVNIGSGYYAPVPVYYAPQPVYYTPRPVYYQPSFFSYSVWDHRPRYYYRGHGHGHGHGKHGRGHGGHRGHR